MYAYIQYLISEQAHNKLSYCKPLSKSSNGWTASEVVATFLLRSYVGGKDNLRTRYLAPLVSSYAELDFNAIAFWDKLTQSNARVFLISVSDGLVSTKNQISLLSCYVEPSAGHSTHTFE